MNPLGSRRDADHAGRRGWTVRTRVLSTMLTFMAVGLAITGVLTYVVQFNRLEDRVHADLWQELRELELTANSQQDDGSYVHTSLDSLLRMVTESAAPSDNESVLALIDGEPRYKPRTQDFELATPQILEQINALHQPGRTVTTTMEVEGREVRMLIASVRVVDDDAEGIFVVASDIGSQKRELWLSVLTFAVLSVLTLAIAGWVGYLVTGRLLRPLGALREATEEITVDDLGRRVPVPRGNDDISALARNFNRMLERIRSGFAEQRRFMSDVGHELRTPLTIVRGTLEMADPDDPEDVREARDIALDELDRMGGLVGDLSELAASTRPDYVRPRPLDMAAFARSTFARIERIDDREWVLERAAEVMADADEQRLTQAVVQLAANAVRYSAPGSRISFGVDQVLGPDGPEIHVRVQDQGIGIAVEDQRRIFERFTRVDDGRDAGSGLGLPIVLAIAEGHGGVVRLFSRPGQGATFTIVLPQLSGQAGEDEPSSSSGDHDDGHDQRSDAAPAGRRDHRRRGEAAIASSNTAETPPGG